MRRIFIMAMSIFLVIFTANNCMAHFGMIIPSRSTVMDKKDADIILNLAFAHPFAQEGMEMGKPRSFYVYANGNKTDLTSGLKAVQYLDNPAWQADYKIVKPGVYIFAYEPEPYFEQAEDCFIAHYVKTIVGAFGNEDGWDKQVGHPVEIVPLARPFANYAGNVFYGQVLHNGKPLPDAIVEVENLNRKNLHKAPNGYYETQIVKTDMNGIFAFGVPWAGWWGFAALCESNGKIPFGNSEKNVELGGVLWMEFSAPELMRQE